MFAEFTSLTHSQGQSEFWMVSKTSRYRYHPKLQYELCHLQYKTKVIEGTDHQSTSTWEALIRQ